ncbi:MAG: aspartate aminotransferase family protein, partial [Pseudomonadota bacterium]
AEGMTQALLMSINDDGRTYLTQTTLDGRFVIRFQVGQFECTREDVQTAVAVIIELAGQLQTQKTS